MESISIIDGLSLTLVSMITVFAVLTALWGLTELTAKLVNGKDDGVASTTPEKPKPATTNQSQSLAPNPKHQQVAELVALALASEDEPNKKLEIQESIRIK